MYSTKRIPLGHVVSAKVAGQLRWFVLRTDQMLWSDIAFTDKDRAEKALADLYSIPHEWMAEENLSARKGG